MAALARDADLSVDWRRCLPGWQPGAPLLACRELGSGSGGDAWRVSTPAGRFVLKQRRHLDSVVDLQRMRALQNLAADHGCAPRMLALDLTAQVELSEWLPGTTPAADELSRPEFLQRVARSLGRLHRIALPRAWQAQTTWHFNIQDQLHDRWTRLRERGDFADRDTIASRIAQIPAWLAILQNGQRPPALLHLDVHAGNLLVADDLWLLDWEYAHLGDPLWDLASLAAPLQWPVPEDEALGLALLQAAGRLADISWEQLRAARELCRLLHELWRLEQ